MVNMFLWDVLDALRAQKLELKPERQSVTLIQEV